MKGLIICRVYLFTIVMVFCAAGGAAARDMTIDLARDSVDITTGFTGGELVVFGTKRAPGDLAIVIRGPQRKMVVRRKEQVLGMWMNRASVEFMDVPSYYDFALSVPESALAPAAILKENDIGLNAFEFQPTEEDNALEIRRFKEALIWNKIAQGLYPDKPGTIVYLSDDFFRVNFHVPSNVPQGDYTITAYLFNNGEIVHREKADLRVGQTGFAADLYNFAHTRSVLYGLMAVFLAVSAGWSANVFLRRD
jgi:uncharacterized protein (TIGR02186 family)